MKFKKLSLLIALTFALSGCNEEGSGVAELSAVNDSNFNIETPLIENPATAEEESEEEPGFSIDIVEETPEEEESSDEILSEEETNQPPDDAVDSVDEPTPQEEEEQSENEPDFSIDIADDEAEEDEENDINCKRHGNLIVNGSFEDSDDREGLRKTSLSSIESKKWDVYQSLPSEGLEKDSWYTSAGPGIEVQGDNTVAKTPHGKRVVELDSHGAKDTNSKMSQDVLLCRGKHILKFMYYPRTNNAQDNTIEVSVDDKVIKTVDMTKNGKWIRIRAPFRVKEKKSYKISFAAKGNDNSLGGLVDHIRLHKKKRRAGVVTSLLSLGDSDNIPSPLIRREVASAIVRKAVNFASIKKNPKVLMLKDDFHNGESLDDFTLTESVLKELYGSDNVSVKSGEVRSADATGYDVIYIVNPGYPMGSAVTADTLREVKAKGNVGIVIHGDDMARGRNFALTDLTGLKYKNNGTRACGIRIDNNKSNKYAVKLRKRFFKKLSLESRTLSYGNDIDHTEVVNKKIRILAMAKAPKGCDLKIPAIVGYKLKRQKRNNEDGNNNAQ